MADTGAWGAMATFGLMIGLIFFFLLWTTRKLNGPEFEQWRDEMNEWEDSHPVRAKLSLLPFPFGFAITMMGPKPPKLHKNEIPETNEEQPSLENQQGYVPQVSIIDQE